MVLDGASGLKVGVYLAKKLSEDFECDECDAVLIGEDEKLGFSGDAVKKMYAEDGLSGVLTRNPEISHDSRLEVMADNANVKIDGDQVKCEDCGHVVMDPSDYQ